MSLQGAKTTNWQAVLLSVKAEWGLSPSGFPKYSKLGQVVKPPGEITWGWSFHHSGIIKKKKA